MNNLVIVESPTKAATLSQFLGKKYQVLATFGHVRDLPKADFGVNPVKNFEPKYVVPRDKLKRVNQLKKAVNNSTQLILATDPDREGEAISWHFWQLVKDKVKNPVDRVVFHEITHEAVKDAFESPRDLDMKLINAQQARRVLDRLVGYKLSPLLWQKVKSGLSAGRVQSVAVRLICDRQAEIDKFRPTEFWVIEAKLRKKTDNGQQLTEFLAKLEEIDGKKASLKTEGEAKDAVGKLEKAVFKVEKISQKEVKKYPSPPFTTSTLQQAASARLGYSAKRTMRLAQDLYEQGLITYHRTDSVYLADSALVQVRDFIAKRFGQSFLPAAVKRYRVKSRVAQEAHEAIRPTRVEMTNDKLQFPNDYRKLYDLIWKRFVACQMREAIFDQKTVDISAVNRQLLTVNYLFCATGSTVKFAGWTQIFEKEQEEKSLPELSAGEGLDLVELAPSQHFTQGPERFTEGTLVKELEKNGIGRPSTYAPTISTILERNYIEKDGKFLIPTPLGKAVTEFLVKNFPDIVDLSFTAEMEEELDEIARGEREWQPAIAEFYWPFDKHLNQVTAEAEKIKVEARDSGVKCELCGKPMVIRFGKFGKFLACSGFPECKNTKNYLEKTGMICPVCGGDIIVKKSRKGKTFWGCSNYPACTFASWTRPKISTQLADQNDSGTN